MNSRKNIIYCLLIAILLIPSLSAVEIQSYETSTIQPQTNDYSFHVNQGGALNPKIFNLTYDVSWESNSSLIDILYVDAGGGKVVAITEDSVMCLIGGSWTYTFKYDDYEYETVDAYGVGDLDSDGAQEIIVYTSYSNLYAIEPSDGSLLFKVSTLDTSANRIFVGDIVETSGPEIILYSTSMKNAYVFSSTGLYMGSFSMQTIDDIETMISGDISTDYTGSELIVLGYDTSSSTYYVEEYNLWEFPTKKVFVSSLGISGFHTSGTNYVYATIGIENITEETGDEIIIAEVKTDITSNVNVAVLNSSLKFSEAYPNVMSLGSTSEYVKLDFFDYDVDGNLEIFVVTRNYIGVINSSSTIYSYSYPSDIVVWDAELYYNSGTSNITAVAVYSNGTSYRVGVGILNAFNTSEVYNTLDLMVPPEVPGSVVFGGNKYYAYAYGRMFYGTYSGLILSDPSFIYTGFINALTKPELGSVNRLLVMNPSWVKAIDTNGTVVSHYNVPWEYWLYNAMYGEYLHDKAGYELAVFELEDMTNGTPQVWLKIISGSSVIKSINVTFPSNMLFGEYVCPVAPSMTKTIMLMYNYSSSDYYFASLDISTGNIKIGSPIGFISKGGYPARIGGKYYYVFALDENIYLVDPDTGYIAGIIESDSSTIYDLFVKDLDLDGEDEIIVRGSGYRIEVYEGSRRIYQYTSSHITTPIITDVLDYPGYELIFYHYDTYDGIRIVNIANDVEIYSRYANFVTSVNALDPPLKINDDVILMLLDTSVSKFRVVRLLNSSGYTQNNVEAEIGIDLGDFTISNVIWTLINRTDILCSYVMGSSYDKYIMVNIKYSIDNYDLEYDLASPYMKPFNISGIDMVAWNDTIPITLNLSDDSGLYQLIIHAKYYDRDGNLIDTDSFTISLQNETNKSIITSIEPPEETNMINLEIAVDDIALRETAKEYKIVMDKEPPKILLQTPRSLFISKDKDVYIGAYIGDDVALSSVYIDFEGDIIPMEPVEDLSRQDAQYYQATIHVTRFNGNKTMKIVAVDYVGKITINTIILRSEVPLLEQPLVQAGIIVGAVAVAAGGYLGYRVIKRRSTEEGE